MPKRFIDTEIFDDPWFMDLGKEAKILWMFCITKCDHAGLLEWNSRLIQFQTGIEDIESVIEELDNRLLRIDATHYFLPKFFEFQYPNYPERRFPAADSAIKILIKNKLLDKTSITLTEEFMKSISNGNGKGKGKSSPRAREEPGGRKEKDDIDLKPLPNGAPMPKSLKEKFGIK